ncbi:transcriptional regulator [Delftia tsuruhatensis]|uniref:phage regulatory CII family protein n=1 Tax=Delftia tsuruhatensis TaxID=180282 RepID=UPI00244497DC|nr:phage regulatory CII family protein [Delftia tsuruhatensis]MDH0776354.1 transcriptional regulator [Delftia tsuruhatensis]MDH1460091.1 transcriptional regulator [Delftia tsuruhatensis]MDH1823054.1 transcriptional regulator [Delftia tsuruhatensis]WGG12260.1 transcriptional regulator [Delftia tsuruhatensis]
MSALDALRRGADNAPGGRAAIAVRLGKSDEVARKELSGAASHKLGAVDALAIARIACEAGTPHCYDYAAYVAHECGGRFELLEDGCSALASPVDKVSKLVLETSHITSAVIEAMQDGVISDNELAQIEREIAEAEEVLRKLRQAARAVNAAGKPQRAPAVP